MADVTIDGTVSTSSARGMRAVVFTTALIGYWFYIDSDGTFGYTKTTDGGATWGAQVEIAAATTHVAYDVWFDQWTPGDSGTLIHTWYFDTTVDDVFWRSLDTSGDTLGTQRTVFAGASAVAGRGAFVSGTKARDGKLYCAYDMDAGAEKGLHRSTDSGTTWSASLSATFIEATLDEAMLFPASNTGDNADIWAIYFDASAGTGFITLKTWDSSAAAATESGGGTQYTPNSTDLTGQHGYTGTIRHSDGHLLMLIFNARDSATGTGSVYDEDGSGGFSPIGNFTINIDDIYNPAIFINQLTNNLYIAYNGKRDGSEVLGTTTKVYYATSVDGGATWGIVGSDAAYMEGAAGVVVQVWAPLMGSRFYAGWRVGTTLNGNAVNSLPFGGKAFPFSSAIQRRIVALI